MILLVLFAVFCETTTPDSKSARNTKRDAFTASSAIPYLRARLCCSDKVTAYSLWVSIGNMIFNVIKSALGLAAVVGGVETAHMKQCFFSIRPLFWKDGGANPPYSLNSETKKPLTTAP